MKGNPIIFDINDKNKPAPLEKCSRDEICASCWASTAQSHIEIHKTWFLWGNNWMDTYLVNVGHLHGGFTFSADHKQNNTWALSAVAYQPLSVSLHLYLHHFYEVWVSELSHRHTHTVGMWLSFQSHHYVHISRENPSRSNTCTPPSMLSSLVNMFSQLFTTSFCPCFPLAEQMKLDTLWHIFHDFSVKNVDAAPYVAYIIHIR